MDNSAVLLKRAQAADPQAFGALYALYAEELYRYAFACLRNPQDAEDAVQDACIKVYVALNRIRDPKRFKAFFFKTLSNTIKSLKRRKTLAVVSDENVPEQPAPDSPAYCAELRIDLQAALSVLSEEERQIVLLSAVAGLRSREIADAVGMTAGSVRGKLSRALQKIRPLLEDTGSAAT